MHSDVQSMTMQDTRDTSPRYRLEYNKSYHPHRLEVRKMDIKNSYIIICSVIGISLSALLFLILV